MIIKMKMNAAMTVLLGALLLARGGGAGAQFAPHGEPFQPADARGEASPPATAPGQDAVRLTRTLAYDSSPCWSPDGGRLAYTSCGGDGSQNIWAADLMFRDGAPAMEGEPRRLTSGNFIDRDLSWSPDGRTIIFSSNRKGRFKLFTVNADTGRISELDVRGIQPSWSPAGDRIAYVHKNNIWILGLSPEAEPEPLTRKGFNEHPAWSPEGTSIVFASNFDIRLIDIRTGENRPLTSSAWNSHPDWCRSSGKIAFVSSRGGRYDIWQMDPDGGSGVRLTDTESFEKFPRWSPEGGWIACKADYEGSFDIWLIPRPE